MVLTYPINSNHDFREVIQYIYVRNAEYTLDYDPVWHDFTMHLCDGAVLGFTAQGELWITNGEHDNFGAWDYDVNFDGHLLHIYGYGPSEDDSVYEVFD